MRIISILVVVAMIAAYIPAGAQSGWVSIVSPTPGEILAGRRAEVSVSYNTGSSDKVTRIDLDVNGKTYASKTLGEPSSRGITSFVVDTTRINNGAITITAKVYSGNTLIGSASGQSSISNSPTDTIPPKVKIVGITSGKTISGTANIEVSAKDGSDKDPLVSVLVDKSLKLIKNTAPYRYSWDTREYGNGKHVIEAYAYDEAGNRGDAEAVEVIVNNPERVTATANIPTEQPNDIVAILPELPIEELADEPAEVAIPVEQTSSIAVAARSAAARDTRAASPSTVAAKPDRVIASSAPKSDPFVTNKSDITVAAESSDTSASQPEATSVPVEQPTKPKETPKLPEKQPFAASPTNIAAKLDDSTDIAPVVPLQENSAGPDPEPPLMDSTEATADVASDSTDEPSVTTAPIVSAATEVEVEAVDVKPVRLGQKLARPSDELPEPPQITRAPKTEQPALVQQDPDPRDLSVKLHTTVHEGVIVAELRSTIETAGGRILSWNQKTHTALVTFNATVFTIRVGSQTAIIDGVTVKLDSAPFINSQGRTMVDISLLKQVLGARLQVNGATGEYSISVS